MEVEAKLFVGQIPMDVGEPEIRAVFEPHGELVEVFMMRDKQTGKSKGSAFVKFRGTEPAEAAIAALHDKHTIGDGIRPLTVKWADQKMAEQMQKSEWKLFVGQIPPEATESDLRPVFEEHGNVLEVVMLRANEGATRRSAFVKFARKAEADAAIVAISSRISLLGSAMHLVVSHATDKNAGFSGGGPGMTSGQLPYGGMFGAGANMMGMGAYGIGQGLGAHLSQSPLGGGGGAGGEAKLFVGKLPFHTTEAEVSEVFNRAGYVTEIFMMVKPDGSSKGSAFVKYGSRNDADKAIAMFNHSSIMPGATMPMVVQYAGGGGGSRNSFEQPGAAMSYMDQLAGYQQQMPMMQQQQQQQQSLGMGMPYGMQQQAKQPMGMQGMGTYGGGYASFPSISTSPAFQATSLPTYEPPPHMPTYAPKTGAEVKLFVGKLPYSAGEAEVHALFANYGAVTEVFLMRKPDGSSKGSAFVKYNSTADAELSISMLNGNYTMPGSNAALVVKYAEEGAAPKGQAMMENLPDSHPEHKVFVGSLPFAAGELDIMTYFAKFGAVQELFLMRKPDGMSKGAAFIKYLSKEEADKVIGMANGQMFPGGQKPLVVHYAEAQHGAKRKYDGLV